MFTPVGRCHEDNGIEDHSTSEDRAPLPSHLLLPAHVESVKDTSWLLLSQEATGAEGTVLYKASGSGVFATKISSSAKSSHKLKAVSAGIVAGSGMGSRSLLCRLGKNLRSVRRWQVFRIACPLLYVGLGQGRMVRWTRYPYCAPSFFPFLCHGGYEHPPHESACASDFWNRDATLTASENHGQPRGTDR